MISSDGDTGQNVLAITDGASAAVSNSSELRVRYNDTLSRGEYSENGGPWSPFSSASPTSAVFTCPAGVNLNDAAAITGADAADQADANNAAARPCRGFVISKPTATSCILQYAGELSGFVGLTPNATYYLSETAGAISGKPTSPGTIQQVVGWARNTTTLVIDIEQNYIGVPT
jgi:hypothetical protein